jgi:hypothetical protein
MVKDTDILAGAACFFETNCENPLGEEGTNR